MIVKEKAAKAVPAYVRLTSRDPFALRYVAVIFFAMALIFDSGLMLKNRWCRGAARCFIIFGSGLGGVDRSTTIYWSPNAVSERSARRGSVFTREYL